MTVQYKGIKWPSPSNIISETEPKDWFGPWATLECVRWVEDNCKTHADSYILPKENINDMRWAYKKKSDRALDVGSQVHDAIRMYLQANQEPSKPDDEVETAFLAFLEFFEKNKMITIKMEERLFDTDWCGMYDWYGEFNGKFYVIDFKTSKVFSHSMRVQTAAYRKLIELHGHKIDGHGVIRLDKETGLPEWKDYSKFYTKDLNEFYLCKELYFYRKPRIAKQFNKPF